MIRSVLVLCLAVVLLPASIAGQAGVSEADAPGYVFGVTAGNDVSERDWQSTDLQWLIFTGTPGTTRAFKAGDTVQVRIEGIGTLRNTAVAAPGGGK